MNRDKWAPLPAAVITTSDIMRHRIHIWYPWSRATLVTPHIMTHDILHDTWHTWWHMTYYMTHMMTHDILHDTWHTWWHTHLTAADPWSGSWRGKCRGPPPSPSPPEMKIITRLCVQQCQAQGLWYLFMIWFFWDRIWMWKTNKSKLTPSTLESDSGRTESKPKSFGFGLWTSHLSLTTWDQWQFVMRT